MKVTITNTQAVDMEILKHGIVLKPGQSVEVEADDPPRNAHEEEAFQAEKAAKEAAEKAAKEAAEKAAKEAAEKAADKEPKKPGR